MEKMHNAQWSVPDDNPFTNINMTKKERIKDSLKMSLLKRAKKHFRNKEYDKALLCIDKLIKNNIAISFAYMQRSFFNYMLCNYDDSVRDAKLCISNITEDDPVSYKFCCYLIAIKSLCVKQDFVEAYKMCLESSIEYYKEKSRSQACRNFYKQITRVFKRLKNIVTDENEKAKIDEKFKEDCLKIAQNIKEEDKSYNGEMSF